MNKYCVERNISNFEEVNKLFSELYNKIYKGKGVCIERGQIRDYLHYPYIDNKKVVSSYISKGYKKITLTELKSMIMSNKKYTKQDWLDGKIALINHPEDKVYLQSFFQECNQLNSKPILSSGYYRCDTSSSYKGMWVREAFTSLPKVRIKELIINDICGQKIIGYKLKKEYFKYVDVINQLVFYVYGDFNAEDVIDSTMTQTLKILEKSKILDKWFDEVYFKEPKLPIINKYEGKYHKNSHISYGCAELPLEWFISDKNRSMTSITLNSGAVLSKSDIEQIKEYLIYQNNK
jgi:hypothetical protein